MIPYYLQKVKNVNNAKWTLQQKQIMNGTNYIITLFTQCQPCEKLGRSCKIEKLSTNSKFCF